MVFTCTFIPLLLIFICICVGVNLYVMVFLRSKYLIHQGYLLFRQYVVVRNKQFLILLDISAIYSELSIGSIFLQVSQ